MAARVTADDVKKIMGTVPSSVDLTPSINAAHALVERTIAGEGYGEDLLIEIERYLAAHFAIPQQPEIQSVSLGGVSKSRPFPPESDNPLFDSAYGRRVAMLDTSGKLIAAARADRGPVTVRFVSADTSEEVTT